MNAIQWFEIPVRDLDRAEAFYGAVLSGQIRRGTFGGGELLLFQVPFQTGEAVGGSIVQRPDLQPGTQGPLIYLNAFGPLAGAVEAVPAAGGQVLVPYMDLGKFGHAAIILDPDGNKLGLLSHER